MSGIPIERRTEFCLYVLATSVPQERAILRFLPIAGAIKCDMKKKDTVVFLENEGNWWFAFEKPWNHETEPQPSQFKIFFGSERSATIRARFSFRRWRNVQIVPLDVVDKPLLLEKCTTCAGTGKFTRNLPSLDPPPEDADDEERMLHEMVYAPMFELPVEESCNDCRGLGETELEIARKRDRFDFVDPGALGWVRENKTPEEYDRFERRLEKEKGLRKEKEQKRRRGPHQG